VLSTTLYAVAAFAQAPVVAPTPTLEANGDAIVAVQPTQAEIDIGVLTREARSTAAAATNAERVRVVIDRLRARVATPIEPGPIEVRASVRLTVEVRPR
jgi:uncharacterized protein YggE